MSVLGFNFTSSRIKIFQRILEAILIVLMLPIGDVSAFLIDTETKGALLCESGEVSVKTNRLIKN